MPRSATFRLRLGGLAAHALVGNWMSTLDYQALLYDPSVDPGANRFRESMIYIFWHEYIAGPLYLRPHCNLAMLVSRHRDAEWLAHAAHLAGYDTVRGSTNRGGGEALRELVRRSRSMHLAITPDGPRGPRRELASGCIFLASKLGAPIVPFGVGYDRCWRLPSWDRFAVPRPFGRARLVIGPRIAIPPDLDREGIECQRQRVEGILEVLTEEAEVWAQRGGRRAGQVAMRRQSVGRRSPDSLPADLRAFPPPDVLRRSA